MLSAVMWLSLHQHTTIRVSLEGWGRAETRAAEVSAIAAADMVYDFLAILALGVDGKKEAMGRAKDEL